MDKHTPTPWKVLSDAKTIVSEGLGKDFVAETFTRIDGNDSNQETDAVFIVRACNHYEKMLTQLKTFRLLYEKEMGILDTQELDALIAECEK